MQRIWQVRPNRQGKGNDVREVEGISTETATSQHCSAACATLGPPYPLQTCSARLPRLGSASGKRQGLIRLSPSVQQGS